jgi:hypothetical protein
MVVGMGSGTGAGTPPHGHCDVRQISERGNGSGNVCRERVRDRVHVSVFAAEK